MLNYTDLQKGDIILDRKNDNFSMKVRERTNSDYVHARLYVGGTIIESDALGVQPVNPQRILYESADDVIVMRPKGATEQQIAMACMFARSESAREYGGREFGRVLNPPSSVVEPNRQICTRLVAQAYRYAGYDIVENADYCSAGDIERSTKLMKIEGMVHLASVVELAIAKSEGIMNMDEGTNDQNMTLVDLLAQVRASIDNIQDIQTETELVEFLKSNSQFDNQIDSIIRSSDYFSLWQRYERENPEEFNLDTFLEKYKDNSLVQARLLLSQQNDNVKIWEFQYAAYSELCEQHNLKCFAAFRELYGNLLDFDRRRRFTLLGVLRVNGQLTYE